MNETTLVQALGTLAALLAAVVYALRRRPLRRGIGGRRLSVLQPVRKCSTCSHWDLEEGQAVIRSNGAFREAIAHVSPAQMSRKPILDPEGKPTGEMTEPSLPLKAGWHDFGACMHHREVRFESDVCGAWRDAWEPQDELVGDAP